MRPLTRDPKSYKREVVWDLETTGDWTGKILCASAVSDDGRVLSFPTFEALINEADRLGWLDGDTRWWAHFGGIFDHLIVLPLLLASGWEGHALSTGPGGGLGTLDMHKGKRRLLLRDSGRVLTDSVAKIGALVGLPKIKEDRSNLEALSWQRLREYCERDCHVVMRGLQYLKTLLREQGGELRDTLASCSATIVRRQVIPLDAWGWTHEDDHTAARAYAGGWVDVFRHESEDGAVGDINSAYPAAMTKPLPTRCTGRGRGALRERSPSELYIVHARVKQPSPLGALFHREQSGPLAGKLLFPQGEFSGVWTLEELENAATVAGVDYSINWWVSYAAEPWLEPLMRKWYARRAASENELERYILKLLLNSLSGKLIERGEYETITTEWAQVLRAEKEGRGWNLRELKGGGAFYVIEEPSLGPLRHAAAAAHVTARARSQVCGALHAASQPAYCDTDSLHGRWDFATDQKALGGWKLEARYTKAVYAAPKLYAVEIPGKPFYVRAKGFAIPRKPDPTDYDTESEAQAALDAHDGDMRAWWKRVYEGEGITREKTVLFKSLLASGNLAFRRSTQTRARNVDPARVGKRARSGVETTAWTVAELEALRTPKRRRVSP